MTKIVDVKTPTVSAEVSPDFTTMQITVKNAETYDQVYLPVWSEVNGQDDLVWYNAEKQEDGSWTYTVNLKQHHSAGAYQIHVYGRKDGNLELIAHTWIVVAKIAE